MLREKSKRSSKVSNRFMVDRSKGSGNVSEDEPLYKGKSKDIISFRIVARLFWLDL